MKDEFQMVIREEVLGGTPPRFTEQKLSAEAAAHINSGLNNMGPGMQKPLEQNSEQPAVKL